MKLVCYVLSLSLAGCALEVASEHVQEDLELDATSQAVQSGYYRNTTAPQFDYAAWTKDVQATGALFVPMRKNGLPWLAADGTPLRGTCGVTFISPHYAVTAAHCVDSTDIPTPANTPLRVEQAHLELCAQSHLRNAENVGGAFPNYTNDPVTEADYCGRSAFSQCYVVKRCSTSYGKYNCNEIANADVALLRCNDRASNAAYMPVASVDPESGPAAIEMTWYHEVYDFPLSQPVDPGPNANVWAKLFYKMTLDRFEHYTRYPGVSLRENNYHYLAKGQQLFSLRSLPWPDGTPRRRLGRNSDGTVRTDLYGCHGTSGSGVFQHNAQGALEYLGPAVGGPGWAGTRLCADPTASGFGKGKASLTYAALEFSKKLAQYAWLQENPVITNPPIEVAQ